MKLVATMVVLATCSAPPMQINKPTTTTQTSITTTTVKHWAPTSEELKELRRNRPDMPYEPFDTCEVQEEESAECDDYWEGYEG